MRIVRAAPAVAAVALMIGTLAACGTSGDSADSTASGAPVSSTASNDASMSSTAPMSSTTPSMANGHPGRDADLRTTHLEVDAHAAVAAATDRVGTGGILHAVEVDWSTSRSDWQWDVKIAKDGTDHKVQVNADTGAVIADDIEKSSDSEQAIDLDRPLRMDDALRIATAKKDGPLRSWKLEYDDGHRAYQFDIGDANPADKTTEVTVDVVTRTATVD